jgi:hypothetical protein
MYYFAQSDSAKADVRCRSKRQNDSKGIKTVGDHEAYGKWILQQAIGRECVTVGRSVTVDYGAGRGAEIDATVGSCIAVEIESRVSKQVRGAVIDLICHRYPKKLLILLPVHMSNPTTTAIQCRTILGRFLDALDYQVVILKGSGHDPQREAEDVSTVRQALADLGWEPGG